MKTPKLWKKVDQKLILHFKCSDFKHALSLLQKIGDIAEKQQHHPDITIQNYNELVVTTTTHEVNKLTEKDYGLAQVVSELVLND